MNVWCVCIEEFHEEEDVYRVEIFSNKEKAQKYINKITANAEVTAEIVQYLVDEPMSGDTMFVIEDSEEDSDEWSTTSED